MEGGNPSVRWGFLYSGLLTDVVFLFQGPLSLVSVGENLDLVEWCNVKDGFLIDHINQSPVYQEAGDTITTLNIIDGDIAYLPSRANNSLK